MSADEAQDMAQDLYLKLDEDRIGPVADPRAYLYRMADNLVLDRRRAALRRLNRETAWDAAGGRGGGDLDPQPSAETRLIDRERLAKVAEALAALPPRTREIFSRYRLAGEPQREIAVALGISLSAVEKHLQRAYRVVIDSRGSFDTDASACQPRRAEGEVDAA